MNNLKLMINIIKRESGRAYGEFYRSHGISSVFTTLCNGTANKRMLSLFGLEDTEKLMLQAVVTTSNAKKIMNELVHVMGIEIPGNGIALTIPVGSIGGSSALEYLTEGQQLSNEVSEMSEMPYALITAIIEKGNIETVMDAARSAGAGGGTVINAKGTGAEFTSKFFGMSIAAEKEIVYIVSKAKDKANIMRAIMEKAGTNSEAHAVVFSLPVDSVSGLRSVTEDEGF